MLARVIKVLDAAPLTRRGLVVLELDAPSPLADVTVGMFIELVYRSGARERVQLKGVGFASSTPEHAHIIVSSPAHDDGVATLDRIEVREPASASGAMPPGSPGR